MDTAEHSDAEINDSHRGESKPELVRTSRLAVVACVLAVASLLLLPGLMWAFRRDTPESVRSLYMLILLATWFLAGLLGIVALVQIATSAGRLTGKGFACMGVAIPAAEVLLLFLAAMAGVGYRTADRMVCGGNLSGIGKAMLIYANDYGDELPRAGGLSSQWTGRIADWAASDRRAAYGLSSDGNGGQVSVSASLYLLVKYEEVLPKAFLCGGTSRQTREKGVTEFKRNTYRVQNKAAELIDFWDFGPNPPKHCSYAYHMPYGPSKLTVAAEPGFAVAGDRNPWMDSPSAKAGDFSAFQPEILPFGGTSVQAKAGNTFRHQGEGQNVMFLDTHVDFQKRSYCGLDEDNIYTSWDGRDKARGVPPRLGSVPADGGDSLLVNDPIGPSK